MGPIRAAIALLILGGVAPAPPDIDTGSAVVVGYSKYRIVIAADSRTTHHPTGTKTDTQCKIFPLSEHFAFAIAGMSGVKIGAESWDPAAEAQKALRTVSSEPRSRAAGFDPVEPTADLWATRTSKRLKTVVATNPEFAAARLQAAFAGNTSDGTLSVVTMELHPTVEEGVPSIKIVKVRPALTEGIQFLPLGKDGIAHEIIDGKTPRAKQEIEKLRPMFFHKTAEQTDIFMTTKLVELTLLYDPQKEDLAPPIDVLKLDGNGIQWISCKANCRGIISK